MSSSKKKEERRRTRRSRKKNRREEKGDIYIDVKCPTTLYIGPRSRGGGDCPINRKRKRALCTAVARGAQQVPTGRQKKIDQFETV